MEQELGMPRILQVASSFTCTPIEPSLRRAMVNAGIADGLGFAQYAQMSAYMLAPAVDETQIMGTVIALRVEDWLRDDLKSRSVDSVLDLTRIREILKARADEFLGQLEMLARRGKQAWFLGCPSTGWISERHKLGTLCRTYANLVHIRVQNMSQITTLSWPFSGEEIDDRSADRLGQVPYTRDGFDRLGKLIGAQVAGTLTRGMGGPASAVAASAGRSELAAYLAGLRVRVELAPAEASDRGHVDRILRTAAGFSLAGEKRDISEEEIDGVLQDGGCMLISVSDRLSDYGVCGLVGLRAGDRELIVEAMAVSCAVLGKQVEFAVFSALARIAAERDCAKLVFEYRPSGRNQPMLSFLKSVAEEESETRYVVPPGSAEGRIKAAAVNAGAWVVKTSSAGANGAQSVLQEELLR